jgi:myb proto-oncogene protein
MIPFVETKPQLLHTGGQSSSRQEDQEPGPRTVKALAIALPTHYDSASEFGSSGATPTAATRLLSFGDDARSPASGVDPLVFVDPDDDEAFCPEPLAVVPPSPFFGMDEEEYVHFGASMHQGVRFDDLTPETLDFFGLPPSAQP